MKIKIFYEKMHNYLYDYIFQKNLEDKEKNKIYMTTRINKLVSDYVLIKN